MKHSLSTIALLALIIAGQSAHAAGAAGTIVKHDLNGDPTLTDRGVCVQLSPQLPAPGWACLYKSNPLYKEMSAFLLTAYVTGTVVSVHWNTTDSNGYPIIYRVQ